MDPRPPTAPAPSSTARRAAWTAAWIASTAGLSLLAASMAGDVAPRESTHGHAFQALAHIRERVEAVEPSERALGSASARQALAGLVEGADAPDGALRVRFKTSSLLLTGLGPASMSASLSKLKPAQCEALARLAAETGRLGKARARFGSGPWIELSDGSEAPHGREPNPEALAACAASPSPIEIEQELPSRALHSFGG